MNVIFTCGGTAGHVNPAIAVANIWMERHPESKILFIGGEDEMERDLVPKAGYEFFGFDAACFHRGRSWEDIRYNIRAVGRVYKAFRQCRKRIKEFGADIVVGTGGYASFPALLAGRSLKLPTCVHESNALPGLTTRMVADWVDRVLICFPESAKHYRHADRAHVVGMPVRREFIFTKREDARKELNLGDKPLVVTAFGSQGARAMNMMTGELLAIEQKNGFPFWHIHAIGSYGMDWMPDHIRQQGVDLDKCPELDVREYIYNMPTVLAAADIFIGRAGSSTCNEIAASGTPCILIPSPNVTDNHQEKNARAMESQGGAVVILEKDCTAAHVYDTIQEILSDPQRAKQMRGALQGMTVPDSAEQICKIMEELIAKKGTA